MVLSWHYSDVTMGAMASQIISVSIVCLTVCSSAHQRKHQSSVSLAFVRGFPSQRASNAENVSICWRHHGMAKPWIRKYTKCKILTALACFVHRHRHHYQRTYDAFITPLLHHDDATTSLCRYNYISIASCVHWALAWCYQNLHITLVKSPIDLGDQWPWSSRSNSRSKSQNSRTCPRQNSSYIQARITKCAPNSQSTLIKILID